MQTKRFSPIIKTVNWKPITKQKNYAKDGWDVCVSYYVQKGTGLDMLSIRFSEKVAEYLKLGDKDKVAVFEDPEDPHNFLIVKSDNGYAAGEYTPGKRLIALRYNRKGMKYFKSAKCDVFYTEDNTVTLRIPTNIPGIF